jgi:hypothetical protein
MFVDTERSYLVQAAKRADESPLGLGFQFYGGSDDGVEKFSGI